MHKDFLFDTRFAGDGFDFESVEFPQGNVVAAVAWAERFGVDHLVRAVCQPGAVAVLRSRHRYTTREEAERAMARFLDRIARSAAWSLPARMEWPAFERFMGEPDQGER